MSHSVYELGFKDDEISVISSEHAKEIYYSNRIWNKKQSGKELWYLDIAFEPIPSDYTLLCLKQLPKINVMVASFAG